MTPRPLAVVLVLALVLSGCNSVRRVLGFPEQYDPSVELKAAESRWLLVQNPRFGDVPSEPEYIWVEEDNVPTTLKTLLRGQKSIIAAPEIVAKYGAPPGGGKISSRQRMPYQTGSEPSHADRTGRNGGPAVPAGANATVAPAAVVEAPKLGYVVQVDLTRIAIDLTAADGVREGGMVSIRRDRTPVIHPVTGEVLGELDQEVATARVTEVRDRFSVAEIQTVSPGEQIQVRDRVVAK
ncbi:MAG: FlgT C-terminal domain-containing protein [Candidatus Rokuibacteriota bacterium]